MADPCPRLEWLKPSLRATHRGVLHRSPADSILAWEASRAGADDWHDGAPLDPSAWVLRYALGGGVEATVHATADAAKTHAEATLRMRGML